MKIITQAEYQQAAGMLKVDIATIKAVTEVEAKGSGFLANGEVKILFEPYVFGRQTKHKFNGTEVTINGINYPISLSGSWDAKKCKYGTESIQHEKRRFACKLDDVAANKSCSWGLFQIMGFNHESCGFKTVYDMIASFSKGEGEHLKAFCNFVLANKMDVPLRAKKWGMFASMYNGPGYKANKYDEKLEQAYKKYSK